MKVEELPQEGFAECPRYITLMRFAFLTGLSDRPDLLYAWIEAATCRCEPSVRNAWWICRSCKNASRKQKRGRFNRVNRPFLKDPAAGEPLSD